MEKLFVILLVILVVFGGIHFIADHFIIDLPYYEELKWWIGKITISLTILMLMSLIGMLIKFLMQK